MTVSTQTLAPGTHTVPGTGAYAQPEQLELLDRTGHTPPDPDYWPWAAPTNPVPAVGIPEPGAVRGHSPRVVGEILHRASSDDFHQWMNHIRGAAGACKHPIRLEGQIHVTRHGQTVATYTTESMPDGAIYTACGNRRHTVCPSFGPVHHRVVKTHAADCRRKDGCQCRPAVCRPFGKTCPHGTDMTCHERHTATDTRLGRPLCLDCYDHTGQVVWHHEAPELWRRTIQQVDRELRRLGRTLGVELRRRYLKVYEFQVRGVIHYHALIRLDGYNPDCPEAVVPPPAAVTRDMLETAVRDAFQKTAHTSPAHSTNPDGWPIEWGAQLDIRHVNAPGGEVNLGQVTGYIAKYVTKGTETTGLDLRRVDELTLLQIDPDTHPGRLIHTAWHLGEDPAWWRLRRYAHQYGYGGHITTKSRRFSVTMGFLRHQRVIWQRTQGHPQTWDDNTAAQVISELGYQATGWRTTGDRILANTAANLARQYAATTREETEHHAAIASGITSLPRAA